MCRRESRVAPRFEEDWGNYIEGKAFGFAFVFKTAVHKVIAEEATTLSVFLFSFADMWHACGLRRMKWAGCDPELESINLLLRRQTASRSRLIFLSSRNWSHASC
jgi:hypothetical protein